MKPKINKYDKPGKWKRVILFEKAGEEKEWLGIIDARERGDYELLVLADHKMRETKGRITVRAVVGKGARARICGKIKIEEKIQEVDSFLELRVLLLDDISSVIVEPQLEIMANEVKAGHAASVGEIEEEQVVYLMSRGLSRQQAKNEIIKGFISG